eukprot:scaffold36972_cov27-Prasinocladus_malaysianus.AAC.7
MGGVGSRVIEVSTGFKNRSVSWRRRLACNRGIYRLKESLGIYHERRWIACYRGIYRLLESPGIMCGDGSHVIE